MSVFKSLKRGLMAATVVAATASSAQASSIAVFDLLGSGGASLPVTTVASGMTVSPLAAVGALSPAAGLTNHFYFTGWGAALDTTKYLSVTLASAATYLLSDVTFSVESTTTSPTTVFVRSSVDSFATDLSSFAWGDPGTSVTNGTLALGLGPLTGPTELRFYFTAPLATTFVGFANHEPPGAGGGLADIGRDISINGDVIPEPASMLLLGSGLVGLVALRRRRRK